MTFYRHDESTSTDCGTFIENVFYLYCCVARLLFFFYYGNFVLD